MGEFLQLFPLKATELRIQAKGPTKLYKDTDVSDESPIYYSGIGVE